VIAEAKVRAACTRVPAKSQPRLCVPIRSPKRPNVASPRTKARKEVAGAYWCCDAGKVDDRVETSKTPMRGLRK
jgi:hypothetical protein